MPNDPSLSLSVVLQYVLSTKYKYLLSTESGCRLLIFRRIPGAARESIEDVLARILQRIVR